MFPLKEIMNALFPEIQSVFQKIAVRLAITIFVTVIFLGDSLYFSGNPDIAHASSVAVVQTADPAEYREALVAAQRKLWAISLQRRYGKAYANNIKDGVVHIRLTKYLNGKPLKINVIEVNSRINPDIKIAPIMAGQKLARKSTVVNMAQRNNSFAAINGSYFKPQTGVPLGILMIDKKILTGPIYDRVALGITDTGYKMDRVSLNSNLIYLDKQLKVNNINQPRTLSTDVLIYTEEWGATSPQTPKYGLQIAVSDGKIIARSHSPLTIPENGYVISAPEKKLNEFFSDTEVSRKIVKKNRDTEIYLDIKTNPDWDDVNHIIGGGPFLVKDGNIFVDYVEEKFKPITGRNPRTAIGYTKEGNFIMVTIDGREETSVGAGLYELAKIMKSFDCQYAMNLDGGGSSTMQINGRIVNNPSIKGGIAVSNALALSTSTEKITYAK